MALAVDTVLGVPGVYRQAAEAAAGFPRLRSDVVGFVGVAGPNRLGEAVMLDDWRSYELNYLRDANGDPLPTDDIPLGAQLRDTVRAYFANGGARCWVVNVAAKIEESEKLELLDKMLGWSGRTGLELLLIEHREVAIVVLPELEAWVAAKTDTTFDAPIADQGVFQCCPAIRDLPPISTASGQNVVPLFTPAEVMSAQRAFLTRVGRDKCRVFALVTVPAGLNPAQVAVWREALAAPLADPDAGALYWPWVHASDRPGQPYTLQPPLGFVAGVYARRDLARGPHVAPANESLVSVVSLERDANDEEHGKLNGSGVNVLRPFTNRGIQVWGARTLAFGRPTSDIGELGFVNVRRCLSAIERTADFFGQRSVFEPNQPMTRFVLAQALTRYLIELFRKGAFKGETEEESFFVRCDDENNPPDLVDAGELICEIGVAIAAPAEFVVFRLGRRDGVVEIEEVG
jgi:uncharacterized protein